MSTSAPNPSGNINANLLSVMQSLSNAVEGLNQNVQQIRSGGSLATPTNQSGSQLGGNSTSTGGSVSYAPSSSSAVADLAALIAAQKQSDSTDAAAESGSSASTPPNGSSVHPGGAPSATEALTWESLANLNTGGPLGQFRRSQYEAQQYQLAGAWALSKVGGGATGGTPSFDSSGNPVMNDDGTQQMDPTLSSRVAGSGVLNVGGALGLSAISSAISNGSNFASIGQALGYGNRVGVFGALRGQEGNEIGAVTEGARLRLEQANLHTGGGLTSDQSQSIVDALAGAGFSDQNQSQGLTAQGDNATIAQGLSKPLVQQGVSAEGAAEWTEALRNAGTSVSALTTSLKNMDTAAQATKLTTDQFNSALLSFAQSQVANGGTQGQGAATGMDLTAATGLSPTVTQQMQSNPVYQGLMMGENGVLPSDIGNLTPGAQLQGMQSMMSMYGGAFAGLNKNKYETIGGTKVISSYGEQAEAAQIAASTGMTQSQVQRWMADEKSGHMNATINAMTALGNPDAGMGGEGSGLFEILNRSKDHTWSGLSAANRTRATKAWNQSISPDLHDMGLSKSQMTGISRASNVDTKATLLNKDLLKNQGGSAANQILGSVKVTVEVAQNAKSWIKATSNKKQIALNSRAGGAAPNSWMNSTSGDAYSANESSWSTAAANDTASGYNPDTPDNTNVNYGSG